MQMTEYEIVVRYNQAKNQPEQIQILAQLNQCDTKRIKSILAKHGAKPRAPFQPTGLNKVVSDHLRELMGNEPATVTSLQIGATVQSVRNWRCGRNIPPVEYLIRIAKYYNVSTDWLLGLDDDTHTEREER